MKDIEFSFSCSRREALMLLAKSAAGAAAFGVLSPDLFSADAPEMKEAMFYEKLPNGKTRCLLCPRAIEIDKGKLCFCRTRKNINGKLFAIGYNKPCIVNFEPVERGPLYHFMSGTDTMSTGAAGCNMECLYCQNFELAQASPDQVKAIDLNVTKALREKNVKSLTLTYTDISCQPEYFFELADTAKALKIPVIACTGAYINPEPLKEYIKRTDAFAVTLKAHDDDSYLKLTGVHNTPVLDALLKIRESGKWLEVITLIVPEYNDSREGIKSLAKWIYNNLGADTPWHISRFTPHYRLRKLPPTPRKTMEEARQSGLESGLKYVYITNLAPHDGNNTYCPKCGQAIVERLAFKVTRKTMKGSNCGFCGEKIAGVWI